MTGAGSMAGGDRPSRRSLLLTGGGAAIIRVLSPRLALAETRPLDRKLVAARGHVQITAAAYSATDVWCYEGAVPGPEIRLRQGGRVRVAVENRLAQDTTVHWHGIRVPNGMDGAPYVTQPPIEPEGSFTYEFTVPDTGTTGTTRTRTAPNRSGAA